MHLQISGEPWQLQVAKARFSELFTIARTRGPQLILRQKKDGVVMMSAEQYELLVARALQPKSLVQFFHDSPLSGLDELFERDKDTGREIDL